MASGNWLLAAGVCIWVVILSTTAWIVVRLIVRTKQIRRLREHAYAEALDVAEQFAAQDEFAYSPPGEPSTPSHLPPAAHPVQSPRSSLVSPMSARIRGAMELFVEAMALPPRAAILGRIETVGPTGLSPEEIEQKAPIVCRYRTKYTSDVVSTAEDEEDACCVICLDNISQDAKRRVLPCLHEFHPLCIQLWLPRANRCPTCQVEVMSAPAMQPTEVLAIGSIITTNLPLEIE
jgi:Ring finger domain